MSNNIISEQNIHYFRDKQKREYPNWNRFEYTWHSPNGKSGIGHVYLEGSISTGLRQLYQLFHHWSVAKWSYDLLL